MDNAIAFASAMGLLSAASLPLGALLGVYWKPGDREVSFFLAFGGGALLAALAVELVAKGVAEGHVFSMAAGATAGGLVFKALNGLVNARGGYLRKPSTAIGYWEDKAARRFAEVMGDLKRATVFGQLPSEQLEALLPHALVRQYPKGTTLYRAGDPAENLYIIEEGEIDLLDPKQGRRRFEHLKGHAAFGRLSFLVGSPRATEAVTATDARLLIIPRSAYFEVLDDTPETRDIVARRIADEEVRRFLEERLDLSPAQAGEWVAAAAAQMRETGSFDPPVRAATHEGDLTAFLAAAGRTAFFASLPESDLRDIGGRLIAKSAPEGHTFFHLGELAQRLYILRKGTVALIDPLDPSRRPHQVQPGEVFGQHAFFTDGPHTVTAVAAADCEFLVLRRKDFDALLDHSPSLQQAMSRYLQRDQIRDYLTRRQRIDATKAAGWLDKAVKSIQRRELFPSLAEMKTDVEAHTGAAMAILLGSFLDGVPEGVVVGAGTVGGQAVSLALLGSIFLSNFPEALSSSAGMREQGFKASRILAMWAGLTLMIGLVSGLGAATMAQAPKELFAVIEGFAAGAMLTVVAETMLPEAYHRGGGIVGLSTLAGFLAAVLLSALE